jgi:GTP-sensing pleiotropic transcriptional regulator CodY
MNVGELYNNLDVNYDRIELYIKNCREIGDWYHKKLIEIYEQNEDLKVDETIEDFHGEHRYLNYTDDSLDKIDNFIEKLNKIINDKPFNYNSSHIIN